MTCDHNQLYFTGLGHTLLDYFFGPWRHLLHNFVCCVAVSVSSKRHPCCERQHIRCRVFPVRQVLWKLLLLLHQLCTSWGGTSSGHSCQTRKELFQTCVNNRWCGYSCRYSWWVDLIEWCQRHLRPESCRILHSWRWTAVLNGRGWRPLPFLLILSCHLHVYTLDRWKHLKYGRQLLMSVLAYYQCVNRTSLFCCK